MKSPFAVIACITQPIQLKVSQHLYDEVIRKSHQSASALSAVTHTLSSGNASMVFNIFFGLDPGTRRLFMIVLFVCCGNRKQQYVAV